MSAARTALAVALLAAAGCAELGQHAAERTTEHVVSLGARTLVVDGTRGRVRVRESATAGRATVRVTARARGATPRSAQARLDLVEVREARDADLHQLVWRVDLIDGRARDGSPADGLSADADVVLPRGASLVVHLESGDVELSGLTGLLEVEVERGSITATEAAPAPGMAWALDTFAGDVSLAFADGVAARLSAETDSGAVALVGEVLDRAPSGRAALVRVGGADAGRTADVSVWTGRGDVTATQGG